VHQAQCLKYGWVVNRKAIQRLWREDGQAPSHGANAGSSTPPSAGPDGGRASRSCVGAGLPVRPDLDSRKLKLLNVGYDRLSP
jgi:hypothetical protein